MQEKEKRVKVKVEWGLIEARISDGERLDGC